MPPRLRRRLLAVLGMEQNDDHHELAQMQENEHACCYIDRHVPTESISRAILLHQLPQIASEWLNKVHRLRVGADGGIQKRAMETIQKELKLEMPQKVGICLLVAPDVVELLDSTVFDVANFILVPKALDFEQLAHQNEDDPCVNLSKEKL